MIMKRLQNITIKRSRGTFNKKSIINKMRALKASASKKQFDVPKLEGSATPESEGEMLRSSVYLLGFSLSQRQKV